MNNSFVSKSLEQSDTDTSKTRLDNWRNDVIEQIPTSLKLWAEKGDHYIRRKYLCPIELNCFDVDSVTRWKISIASIVGDAFEPVLRSVVSKEIERYNFTKPVAATAAEALVAIARTNMEELWFERGFLSDGTVDYYETRYQAWAAFRRSPAWGDFGASIGIVAKSSLGEKPAFILDMRHTYKHDEDYPRAGLVTLKRLVQSDPFVNYIKQSFSKEETPETDCNSDLKCEFGITVSQDLNLVSETKRTVLQHPRVANISVYSYTAPVPRVRRKSFKKLNNYKQIHYSDSRYNFTEDDFKTLVLAWLSGLAIPENRPTCLRSDLNRSTNRRLHECAEIAFAIAKALNKLQEEYLRRRILMAETSQAEECLSALLRLSKCSLEDTIGYTLFENQTLSDAKITRLFHEVRSAQDTHEKAEDELDFGTLAKSKWSKLLAILPAVADSRQLLNLTFHFFPEKKVNFEYRSLVDVLFEATEKCLLNEAEENCDSKKTLDPAEIDRPIDITRLGKLRRA